MKIPLDKQSYIYLAFSCIGFLFAIGVDHFALTGELNYIPNYISAAMSSIFVILSLMAVKKRENNETFKKTSQKVFLFTVAYGILANVTKSFLGGVAVFAVGIALFTMLLEMKTETIHPQFDL